jgi:hypothetical protein
MENTHDWTRPLMDELYRPVEVGRKFADGACEVRLVGGKTRVYWPDFSPRRGLHENDLDYPQGTLRYADEPDADGWYHYTPAVDGLSPDSVVSVETHEIEFRDFHPENARWHNIKNFVTWASRLHYRYRPLPEALAYLTEATLTERVEAGEAAKAELDRRKQTDEQAFREALADAFEAICRVGWAKNIRNGDDTNFVSALMVRFTLKDKPDA